MAPELPSVEPVRADELDENTGLHMTYAHVHSDLLEPCPHPGRSGHRTCEFAIADTDAGFVPIPVMDEFQCLAGFHEHVEELDGKLPDDAEPTLLPRRVSVPTLYDQLFDEAERPGGEAWPLAAVQSTIDRVEMQHLRDDPPTAVAKRQRAACEACRLAMMQLELGLKDRSTGDERHA